MAASLATVFMLRAVPFFAAGMRSLDAAMPDRSGHKSRDARGEGWALEIKTLAVASNAACRCRQELPFPRICNRSRYLKTAAPPARYVPTPSANTMTKMST